ncbi:MAG: NADPH-dependent assimilatory sulfite reductase hemoprotein subunit [Acidimicrobiales bacterium]
MTTTQAAPTAEEGIKSSSDFLRGELATELASAEPKVSGGSEHLLKFHGIYAQDNRDVRRERSLAGETLDYIFMIRVAIPGGHLTSEQWLALDRVADDIADGTIRLTTRQAVQFHGVLKQGLRPLAHTLDEYLMTSFGACGDVVRNTVICPDLTMNASDHKLRELASRISRAFKPKTLAHWEIFVNGDLAASHEESPEHSFYGTTYLPRKFKIAIAHPGENCVDVFSQDLGLIPATHDVLGDGFTVVVGGGLGRSYADADTFARLADPLTFVTHEEIEDLIAAVLRTYHELGNRTNRKRARMKYLVADAGFESFRREVEQRYAGQLRAPVEVELAEADDHLGWRQLHDGTHQVGVRVGAGRVRDVADGQRLRSALRVIAQRFAVTLLITAQQDILISAVSPLDREAIEEVLATHHVRSVEELGNVERSALACPALPTCGQALTEAERRLPSVVEQVQGELDSAGLGKRRLQLRMTGCPNGCARPAVSEVGIVGRTKNTYDLYLGGGLRGDRLAALYQEKLKLEEIPEVLRPLLERWKAEGVDDESFGDFFDRVNTP